eukprot:1523416-Lingulodinium_polyedra.AAC.1
MAFPRVDFAPWNNAYDAQPLPCNANDPGGALKKQARAMATASRIAHNFKQRRPHQQRCDKLNV